MGRRLSVELWRAGEELVPSLRMVTERTGHRHRADFISLARSDAVPGNTLHILVIRTRRMRRPDRSRRLPDLPVVRGDHGALTHLQRLEAESIHIMREVAAEAENPVMLYSIGKDSAVMLDLAMRAFYPAKPPFPLLHVDTTWKFREMYEFRDRIVRELGVELLVHVNREGVAMNVNPFDHGSGAYADVMKTEALKQALDEHGFDVAFGGARRDEERSGAKERIFSFRTAMHTWDPKNQRPELWRLFNSRKRKGESILVFPLSNWTELDVWLYIYRHAIPIVPLYLAAERPVVEREGTLIMVDDERFPLRSDEHPELRKVRFRTLSCYPLSGAIESDADTVAAIVQEMLVTTSSERQGRLIDHDGTASMERKSLVRLLLCGSVDDGKSTLIGRVLYETLALYADQLATLESESRKRGTADGEQCTRNMVTDASTADCAVILIDAGKGVLRQTRRHSYLVDLLGIPEIVVAVNKMDQVGYAQETFAAIEREYGEMAARIGLKRFTCIPISALRGANVLHSGEQMPWFTGPSLMEHLEAIEVQRPALEAPFRMPVQWVNRTADFRGFAGTVVSGTVAPGDSIVVAPSGRESRIARIVTYDGDLEQATAGQSVTVTLAEQIDTSRGDVIAAVQSPPQVSDLLQATIVWMHEEPMLPGRSYVMRIGSKTVAATVAPLKYKLNVDSLEHVAATKLELNEIGVCDLELSQPVAFDHYADNRDTGSFILIDRITNDTVGAGLIKFALRRAQNIRWQALTIDRAARAEGMRQTPCVLWCTGLSGAGKSTIANRVEAELHRRGQHTYLLDGDNVRHGLNRDLGFTDADRVENIRRVAEVAKLMVDAGLIVITSFISPFRSERQMARALFEPGQFFEVFVDTPLAVAEERDPKGLYKKARRGELRHFTGIDSAYEPPERPEIRLDTTTLSAPESARLVLDTLEARGLVARS